jgi:hypothetical protein
MKALETVKLVEVTLVLAIETYEAYRRGMRHGLHHRRRGADYRLVRA